MSLGSVSEVYSPVAPNVLHDEPITEHYKKWGYSIGYETLPEGQNLPEGGNTAVFRIAPDGLTEPVYVTKPENDATFTVKVVSGNGELIRARANGDTEKVALCAGTQVVIEPGEAYAYNNTDPLEDLILHDVALPALRPEMTLT